MEGSAMTLLGNRSNTNVRVPNWFGPEVAEQRLVRGLSQVELAARSDDARRALAKRSYITIACISEIESGKRTILPWWKVAWLCRELRINLPSEACRASIYDVDQSVRLRRAFEVAFRLKLTLGERDEQRAANNAFASLVNVRGRNLVEALQLVLPLDERLDLEVDSARPFDSLAERVLAIKARLSQREHCDLVGSRWSQFERAYRKFLLVLERNER